MSDDMKVIVDDMQTELNTSVGAFYYERFLTEEAADALLAEMLALPMERHTVFGHPLGRKTAVFADDPDTVVVPQVWGEGVRAQAWTPMLKKVRDRLLRDKAVPLVCLVNRYDNGGETIGWHSDNEEIGSNRAITSISLGAERLFQFRPKTTEPGQAPREVCYEERLRHGSMLLMLDPCQETHQHRLVKEKAVKGARVNLTFRPLQPLSGPQSEAQEE